MLALKKEKKLKMQALVLLSASMSLQQSGASRATCLAACLPGISMNAAAPQQQQQQAAYFSTATSVVAQQQQHAAYFSTGVDAQQQQQQQQQRRLGVLEQQLNATVRGKHTQETGPEGSSGNIHRTDSSSFAGKAASTMEDAGADALRQLHPAFTQFLNSGYMESQRQLRERLMRSEWDDTVRSWALRKGLAEFERFVAEKGEELGVSVSWEDMQKLYASPDPHDLSALAGQPRARLLAQAFIQQELVKQQLEVYKSCSDTARQLANVIESSHRTGASTLLGLVRKVLPLPFFK